MPTKKDLAARLNETPQPPLRLGRGVRLSRAAKPPRALAPKVSALPEPASLLELASVPEFSVPVDQPPAELTADSGIAAELPVASAAVTAEGDVAATPIAPAALADPEPHKPERDKRKLQLRKDLLKQCKRIARAQDRKLYQVIESALEEYIQRHGALE